MENERLPSEEGRCESESERGRVVGCDSGIDGYRNREGFCRTRNSMRRILKRTSRNFDYGKSGRHARLLKPEDKRLCGGKVSSSRSTRRSL